MVLVLAALIVSALPVFAGGQAEQEIARIDVPTPARQFISPATPEGNNELQLRLTVSPSTGQAIVEYRLYVFDGEGRLVYERGEVEERRRGFFQALTGGDKPSVTVPETLTWDGRDADNRLVDDGDYTYVLEITEDDGRVSRTAPYNVTVDNTPPIVRDLSVDATRFAPIEGSDRTRITVLQDASSEREWRTIIRNEAGEIVFQVTRENTTGIVGRDVPPAPRVPWDGTFLNSTIGRDGEPVPEGAFTVELTGRDRAGNMTTERLDPRVVMSRTLSPLRVTLGDQPSEFSYAAADPARRVLRLYLDIPEDEVDSVVNWQVDVATRQTPARPVWTERGTAVPEYVEFNGLTAAGIALRDGNYVARLTVGYDTGLTATSPALDFVIDTVPPSASIAVTTEPAPTERGQTVVFGGETRQRVNLRFSQPSDQAPIDGYAVIEYEGVSFGRFRAVDFGITALPFEYTWEGEDLFGEEAPDGRYTIQLEGLDTAGNLGRSNVATVIKDTAPRHLDVRYADTDRSPLISLRPESEQRDATILVDYEPSEYIELMEITIRGEDGRVAYTRGFTTPFQRHVWNGTQTGGRNAPDGNYTVDVRVVWKNGDSMTRRADSPIIVESVPPGAEIAPLAAIEVTPTPFSPDEDGVDDILNIYLSATSTVPVARWSVDIRDRQDRVFRSFTGTGVPRPRIEWDGRSDTGVYAAPGSEFTAVFTVRDTFDNVTRETAAVRVAEETREPPFPPRLTITASPVPFSPDGDGVDDTVSISLAAVSEVGLRDWELEIHDRMGNVFRRFSGTGAPPARIVWDGSSDSDLTVMSAEDYTAVFTVTDTDGQVSEATTTITTDILVMRDGDKLRIIIPSIQFMPYSSDLFRVEPPRFEQNLETLRRLATILNRFPDRTITIEGHAARQHFRPGAAQDREEREILVPLSNRRAEEVRRSLTILGVDYDRMSTTGYGGRFPIVPHSDRENLWQNRRVEFILER